MRLLRPVAQTVVSARTNPFNAAEFYRTRTGLYVCDTFATHLNLRARKIVDSAPERPYVALLLKENAYDDDIRKELPENHLSTLEDIAGFIETQSRGKPGLLHNNFWMNIFYVEGKNSEVFVAGVRWDPICCRWLVDDWELNKNGRWPAGRQIICPGTIVLL